MSISLITGVGGAGVSSPYLSAGVGDGGSSESAGPGFDVAASALIARMTTPPDETREGHINTLIVALKAAGVWDKMDILYVLAAHDAQAAGRNWKAATFELTLTNAPTFTTDRGYAGNGTSSYLDTTWDAATNGVQFARDSATAFIWSRTAGQVANATFGTGTANATSITTRNTSDLFSYRINQSSSTTAANTDGSGLLAVSRSGASATQSYRNGAALGSAGAAASTALSSSDINIGRVNTSFSNVEVAAAGLGANLSGAEHAAAYTALAAYMTAVGA